MARRNDVPSPTMAVGVDNRLPRGARDLLPPACRQRQLVTEGLLGTFERWGFERIAPPSVEYFEVIGRGLGREERERCVRFIEAESGEVVSLRPDITPQVARVVAQRLSAEPGRRRSHRLTYAADVVRVPDRRRDSAELHQAGVELIGEGSPVADAEVVAMAHEALSDAGLPEFRLDLAHTGIVRAAFDKVGHERGALRLRGALARKDVSGMSALLDELAVTGRLRTALLSLCELFGPPAILDDARRRLAPLGVKRALDELEAVLDTVQALSPAAHSAVTLDLGEARGFDYYTGLRLRAWAPGVAEPVVRGGRYDDMVRRYGLDLPAIGFAVDLESLEEALVAAGVEPPGQERAPAVLVALLDRDGAARAVAAREAATARRKGQRAWIESVRGLDEAQAVADEAEARRLIAIGADGALQRWQRGAKAWRASSTRKNGKSEKKR